MKPQLCVFATTLLLAATPARAPFAAPASRQGLQAITISQVYTPGGSGGGGSGFGHSFIELHNRTNVAVSVDGWTVQFSQTIGNAWMMTPLSGSIPAGGYYLVQEGNFSGSGNALPTPDAMGTIFMTPAIGKVALVNSATAIVGCVAGSPVLDLMAWGGADCAESAPTPSMTPQLANVRAGQGCQDTDNNAADFSLASPIPRNTASPAVSCSPPPSGSAQANPLLVVADHATLLTLSVTPGSNPPSTGLQVFADLSAVGGSGAEPMFDDGTHGDATSGDDVFSLSTVLPLNTPGGAHTVGFRIVDAQSREFTTFIPLEVLPAIVVSQIYTPGGGGGGQQGYNHSYIELHNRAAGAVPIDGWSIQYASSSGGPWTVTPLSGTIAPGGYLMVEEGNFVGGGQPLPPPDLVGTTFMVPATGIVALLANADPMTGCGAGLALADLVGYGGSGCFEGSGPVQSMTPTIASFRKGDGCRDTDVNSDDFLRATPTPRNSASPPVVCTQTTAVPPSPPGVFALRDLAPNPARDAVTIQFTLANDGPATLSLVDLAGRVVAAREVGDLGRGAHIVRFGELARLSPGVYFARLRQFGTIANGQVIITH